MVSNILHRIFKKGKTLSFLKQFFSRPVGHDGFVENSDPRLVSVIRHFQKWSPMGRAVVLCEGG